MRAMRTAPIMLLILLAAPLLAETIPLAEPGYVLPYGGEAEFRLYPCG